MTAPAISVILPTYNRAAMLARSVGSVLEQSFSDFELLIVDDGSSDDTGAVVAAFGDERIRYLPRASNGGVAAARNTGLQNARGRYLAFQDSDDEWLLGKLERQMASLEGSTDDATMSICGLLRTLGNRQTHQRVHGYPRNPVDWDAGLDHAGILQSAVAYTQTWLVPRAVVATAGPFDESLRVWDDWELLIRVSQHCRIALVQEPLVISERIDSSISAEPQRFLHDIALVLEKHRSHLLDYPSAAAQLHYLHALRHYQAGQAQNALSSLLASLRIRPGDRRAWKLLLRSLRASWSPSRARQRPAPDSDR